MDRQATILRKDNVFDIPDPPLSLRVITNVLANLF